MTRQLTASDITTESSVALFKPGSVGETVDGNTYQYFQANGAKVAATLYSVHMDTGTSSTSYQVEDIADATVTPGDAESQPLCCPPIAMTDNYYAWVFVGPGSFTGTTGESVSADAKLYVSATAGAIDSTATACLLEGASIPADVDTTTGKIWVAHRLYAQDLPA